jgi:endoglucanase
MDETEALFKELTEAPGVPGYEGEVRAIIRRHLEPLTTIERDRMGSIIGKKVGQGERPRIMLASHMDEIGFMVKLITKDGFLRFVPLGGWWDQVLLAQQVVIKTAQGDVYGVVGAKPPHLLPLEDRKKLVERKDMYIDIGASSEEEVHRAGVRPGDPIVPLAAFTPLAPGKTYLAKAWDDRVGCALLIQALQSLSQGSHPGTVYGVGALGQAL